MAENTRGIPVSDHSTAESLEIIFFLYFTQAFAAFRVEVLKMTVSELI